MDKIIFTCKTITPLVMNGAYGNRPELRPPGIKASLRFWWRALNGHLPLDDLRKQEAVIFGSTNGRSKVLIRVVENQLVMSDPKPLLLEHHNEPNKRSPAAAFDVNGDFKIRVDFDSSVITKSKLENLFILACTLGGWGKRSRRGFGSVVVEAVDGTPVSAPTALKDIKVCIDQIVGTGRFDLPAGANKISGVALTKSSNDEYPRLLEVEIGRASKTLKEIGQATHDTKYSDDTSPNKSDYSKSLGDGRPRLASPVIISYLVNDKPVISTMKKQSWVSTALQDKLKNRIL
jgi:CRISPR-associated protein Cmr1